MSDNLLYKKEYRTKKVSFLNWLKWKAYYELEEMPIKQKFYIFKINMELTGFTTQGESTFFLGIDTNLYESLNNEFKKDYLEYIQNPKNQTS